MNEMKIIVAYVPVLHSGYERFFERHRDADILALFGPQTVSRFDWLRKDLRRLSFERLLQAVRSLGIFKEVVFLEDVSRTTLGLASSIVMPDETECREIAKTDFIGMPVTFDPVFLRYDKKRTEEVHIPSAKNIDTSEAVRLMRIALDESVKSPDWWIQVGGLLVRDGEVVIAGHNIHKPDDRETLFRGDPRSNYTRGINIELTLVEHAERVIIGEAARHGIMVSGCDLYVTTFPCPPCAYQIVHTGIKRCFFKYGYSILEAEENLTAAGIELFQVVQK
ncbi:MAG: hypothetical protein A3E02_02575 [Candidatus Zambryskibacteria bacterium RIFCSPHIGHO2_12_FULL_38_34]|uniref:CMP/dCMP-type deaminase domain-containing protein n=1 Tax=Candidatus Zambryskibacteria bacterium RIFCSPLOWO2_12_FULL_39_16 TaxID=1802775 RepID=A0A1G2UTB7_9BACT|nr:MAG: hypothetical protein A3D37_00125 [Candidatus Zambryskibacteria bacterium RIFCSPHIGHO2_02_FULL_38_22]OHA97674.1 MAG: hypothetical protein A3E02_02575 [Candidatus Zambryskibacteria bacterium RIFCSPHIGHO2_12_FULL_38_34]OHB08709.1 MAG: hypothetical protein A3I19_01395 [Candidatus Zambryskibacteria bacterium RIFCSPLOWO2_02_FULL_38_13]OHB12647.1 MAG: hypothetical protein A3G46_02215 [Candidatus Zambryskibacteria bacterium RIFCSPLOWO2_12_FULL_39_16]